MSHLLERIDKIDLILFHAGIATLSATTKQGRKEADQLIIDARIELDKLRNAIE